MAVEGLDVSHFQGYPDWRKVAAAGKGFAFVKLSQGNYYIDPSFTYNRAGCHQAGVLMSAYHFFDPHVDAKQQAGYFCKALGAVPVGELPPALDFESLGDKNGLKGQPLAKDLAIHAAVVFLTEVQNITGRHPIIYSYPDFFASDLGGTKRFSGNPATGDPGWPLWAASYQLTPTLFGGWKWWTFWQWTARGACDGIAGPVDLDRFNGTPDQLKKLAGY